MSVCEDVHEFAYETLVSLSIFYYALTEDIRLTKIAAAVSFYLTCPTSSVKSIVYHCCIYLYVANLYWCGSNVQSLTGTASWHVAALCVAAA